MTKNHCTLSSVNYTGVYAHLYEWIETFPYIHGWLDGGIRIFHGKSGAAVIKKVELDCKGRTTVGKELSQKFIISV